MFKIPLRSGCSFDRNNNRYDVTSANTSSIVDKLVKNSLLLGQKMTRTASSRVNHTVHIASMGANISHNWEFLLESTRSKVCIYIFSYELFDLKALRLVSQPWGGGGGIGFGVRV